MQPAEVYADELVYAHEASAATGVPELVIRQWASRGRIRRYPGDGRPSGNGRLYRTMYALPEVQDCARQYKATPQRAPHAA
ncbi:hypothetical protein JJV70_01935 [Streptomyces sp. JJ66]|uniref:hypothetical protein n=1 Tax=Streptomyces sp. JJ66 TaxID=2803843 RepID=UPI001C5839B9|nr:hypothetical protein [Streptomyces sp. JJ66]MBW1600880.1 hypothetical protein [Streptomyces sp. JJ66]